MGLVDLRTDLKSLRFGKDRVGGGNSNQPYLVRDLPTRVSQTGRTGGPDFLLRGGTLLPRIVANDVSRLTQMLVDFRSPNGPLFIAKQNVLSLANVNSNVGYTSYQEQRNSQSSDRTGVGNAIAGVADFFVNNFAINQGIYTPLSTLGQAAGNALGIHLNKQGLNPLTKTTVGSPLGNTPLGLPTYLNTIATGGDEGNKSRLQGLLPKITENQGGDPELYNYIGGPGAILGVGKTSLNMISEYRTGINNSKIVVSKAGPVYGTGSVISGFRQVPNFSNIAYNQENNPIFPLSETRIVAEREDVPTINYIPNSPNLSPTTLLGSIIFGSELEDKIKNDKLYRVGASAAFYSNASIFRTGVNSDYFIPPFFEQFNADGTIIRNNIYDTILNPYSLETKPTNEAFKSGILRNTERQAWTQQEVEIKVPFSRTNKADNITDFRKVIAPDGSDTIPNTLPYTSANKFEQRVSLGNPGKKANRQSYTIGRRDLGSTINTVEGNAGYENALDKVNALPIYQSDSVAVGEDAKVKNDFVKFRIGVIDNANPNLKTYVHFRAIIDSMSDNYSADWNEISYMGRGEKFYKYKGFNRNISLAWTVAAQSKQELIPMYQKLNYLASTTAPYYSPIGYMGGNLITLTIGGWCYEQPGIMKGIQLGVPTESPWEISIPDAENIGVSADGTDLLTDPSVKELPMIVKVTGFEFIPIHNFVPKVQNNIFNGKSFGGGNFASSYGRERYIALANQGGVNNYSGGLDRKNNKHINYLPKK